MARPKKTYQDARTLRLNLRLTPDERAVIETRAAALGTSPTEYTRRRALGGGKITATVQKADPALVLAVNRIGVNLNQIAHTLNSGSTRLPHDLSETLARINLLLDRMQGE